MTKNSRALCNALLVIDMSDLTSSRMPSLAKLTNQAKAVSVYTYYPHLGLINALPPHLCVSSKRPFSLFIDYQKGQARNMQNYGQDFINHISPLMGGPLCENKIGVYIYIYIYIYIYMYNTCYLNSNGFGCHYLS